jgi:hypothetical protein
MDTKRDFIDGSLSPQPTDHIVMNKMKQTKVSDTTNIIHFHDITCEGKWNEFLLDHRQWCVDRKRHEEKIVEIVEQTISDLR